MAVEMRLSQLRPAQCRLVRLMAEVGYGRIEGLIVQQGQPVFSPGPRIVREIKLEHSSSRPVKLPADFALKVQVCHLLARLLEIRDGRIEVLNIADGLPLRMTVETPDAVHETI